MSLFYIPAGRFVATVSENHGVTFLLLGLSLR